MFTNLHYKTDLFLIRNSRLGRRLSQDDGSVFLERTVRSKTKDGAHKLYAGEGHTETKWGEKKMKPVMVDEEFHTRGSDGRSCSGLTRNEGNVFRSWY